VSGCWLSIVILDGFEECKVVRMPFKSRGKCCKPDLHHGVVIGTGTWFQKGKFVSKLIYVRVGRNDGKWIIYSVQTLFLAITMFQLQQNPFAAVMFGSALQ